VITLSAKADSFIEEGSAFKQQLLRLRMSDCATLTPEGPNGTSPSGIQAHSVRPSLQRFKSCVQDYPAQPPNLKLVKDVVTMPVRAIDEVDASTERRDAQFRYRVNATVPLR
jgi:hypothetical protein